jgi:hypothetical protein
MLITMPVEKSPTSDSATIIPWSAGTMEEPERLKSRQVPGGVLDPAPRIENVCKA